MSNFKKAIKKAKQYYFEIWKRNEKPSPAFNTEIIKVTKAGWNHIVFSSRRNASEIVERLSYIKNARELIERSIFLAYFVYSSLLAKNKSPSYAWAIGLKIIPSGDVPIDWRRQVFKLRSFLTASYQDRLSNTIKKRLKKH